MRTSWSLCVTATLGLSLLSACAAPAPSAKPGAPLGSEALKANPCGMYTPSSLTGVMATALAQEGWPALQGAPPTSRISANVQRCLYRFSPRDSKLDGDQELRVYVYDEMDHGAKLMAGCKAHPDPQVPAAAIGDESCVDDAGQWRVRVGDTYVSVLIDIPPRTVAGERPLDRGATKTFIASSRPADLAALGLPVVRDLAGRLR